MIIHEKNKSTKKFVDLPPYPQLQTSPSSNFISILLKKRKKRNQSTPMCDFHLLRHQQLLVCSFGRNLQVLESPDSYHLHSDLNNHSLRFQRYTNSHHLWNAIYKFISLNMNKIFTCNYSGMWQSHHYFRHVSWKFGYFFRNHHRLNCLRNSISETSSIFAPCVQITWWKCLVLRRNFSGEKYQKGN